VCCVSGASDASVCMPTVHTDCCLQVSFRKRATNFMALSTKGPLIIGLFCGRATDYRALLRVSYKMRPHEKYICVCMSVVCVGVYVCVCARVFVLSECMRRREREEERGVRVCVCVFGTHT